MNPVTPELLLRAFESVAGRDPGRDLPAPALGFAKRVVAAGRALAASEPCPQPAFRRAEALFGSPRGAGARLLALVLDSWSGFAPATRGRGPRLLRYGTQGLGLDVELEPLPDGRTRVRVALTPGAGVAAALEVGGRATRIALDAEGTGEALLPRGRAAARVRLLRGRSVVARTPALPRA